jgi:RND family efflux transporter MFP subunit
MDRLKELRIDRSEKASGESGGKSWLVVILVLVLSVAATAWYLMRGDSTPEVQIERVQSVSAATAAADASVLDASGYVTARRRATVSSKITGKIVEVLVEEGMVIEEGQLLARLDNATAIRQLALTEAQLSSSRADQAEILVRLEESQLSLGRTERLVKENISSQADLDAARASRDALLARLESSRQEVKVSDRLVDLRKQELADTEIRAPFDGVAVTKDAQPGEMISPISAGGSFTRSGICTLVDMTSLEIEVDVNEAYIGRVKARQPVTATLDAYPGWQIPGSVITTVPTADRQKATVQVRIAFDGLDPRILPDMGVRVSFLEEGQEPALDASAPPRLLVPAAAVLREGEQAVVFVLAGEFVERRAIQVSDQKGQSFDVVAGLKAGEQVVVAGPDGLADGDRVRIAQ